MRESTVNARKIDAMHDLFGIMEGKRCGFCPHLRRIIRDRAYYKCECYGISSSQATDWAKSWMACGLADGKDNYLMQQIQSRGGDVINMLKHEPRAILQRDECEGQIRMEEIF